MRLREIATRLDCRLEGDGDIEIRRVAGIDRAAAGDLTFLSNEKYIKKFPSTQASAVIVGLDVPATGSAALLRTDQPYLAFCKAVELLMPADTVPTGIDPLSSIAADATIGADVAIGAFVTIAARASIGARTVIYPNVTIGAGVVIGDDCVVHSQVSIRERVVVGHRVILQDGVVLGSEGFGFAKQPDGTHRKIPQRADIVIEDDVEIGANSTVDRPAIGETRIGAGTKIDNLVQIGHGVRIGRRVLLAAQVGIAGSCELGDDVVLAGQVGVANHVKLGNGVIASAQTGIPNSVEDGKFVSGYPAIDNRDWLKSAAIYRSLPVLKKRVADLEQRLAELEEKLAQCVTPSDQ